MAWYWWRARQLGGEQLRGGTWDAAAPALVPGTPVPLVHPTRPAAPVSQHPDGTPCGRHPPAGPHRRRPAVPPVCAADAGRPAARRRQRRRHPHGHPQHHARQRHQGGTPPGEPAAPPNRLLPCCALCCPRRCLPCRLARPRSAVPASLAALGSWLPASLRPPPSCLQGIEDHFLEQVGWLHREWVAWEVGGGHWGLAGMMAIGAPIHAPAWRARPHVLPPPAPACLRPAVAPEAAHQHHTRGRHHLRGIPRLPPLQLHG